MNTETPNQIPLLAEMPHMAFMAQENLKITELPELLGKQAKRINLIFSTQKSHPLFVFTTLPRLLTDSALLQDQLMEYVETLHAPFAPKLAPKPADNENIDIEAAIMACANSNGSISEYEIKKHFPNLPYEINLATVKLRKNFPHSYYMATKK